MRKEIKEFKGLMMTFEEILTYKMVIKLEERFSFEYRLLEQMKIRPGPEEAKQRWLETQIEKQKKNLRTTARISIQFMKEIHTNSSKTVYKPMDFLLANTDVEHLQYLCHPLKELGEDFGRVDC